MELSPVLRLALVAVMLSALPAATQEVLEILPEMPEGYPPKMGEVVGDLSGIPVAWETFDFSIGAYDASAWAGIDYETKKVGAFIMAYAPGDPDRKEGRLRARAEFGRALKTGKGKAVIVAILKDRDIDGPRLSSEGQKASFVIESIGPKVEGSYSRRVTGRIEATLCPVNWEGQTCQDLVLRFDTDMQMESSLKVRD